MEDIVAGYASGHLAVELRGNWVNVVLHRLPSFLLVWLLARLGVSPMAVSLFSALVALALPLLAWQAPVAWAGIAVCLAGTLFQVLDCTDGALARSTGQVSEAGGRVDFLVDMAQWSLLYLAIGILADRQFDSHGTWSAVALGAAWLRLYARVVRDASPAAAPAPPKRLTAADIPTAALAGLSGAIPFLALSGSWLQVAVVLVLAYSLLDVADAALAALRRQ